jgi:hypothetical protein
MFMGLAEKVGLTGFLAPRQEKKDESKVAPEDSTRARTRTATTTETAASDTATAAPSVEETELENKTRLLQSQKDREIKASGESFAKNQRVAYFHKASNVWFEDTYIVGVHHDDGVDQPYYTIRYKKDDSEEPIEKQTTHDRLKYAQWDPEKTWKILSKKW